MPPYPAAEAVAAAGQDFPRAALVFGTLLVLGALVSGVARRSFLALTPVFVLAGFALGRGGFEVLMAFMSWFGPKGMATMAFSLLVLAAHGVESGERIFRLCALVVVCSVVLHGLSDTPGVRWIARRS